MTLEWKPEADGVIASVDGRFGIREVKEGFRVSYDNEYETTDFDSLESAKEFVDAFTDSIKMRDAALLFYNHRSHSDMQRLANRVRALNMFDMRFLAPAIYGDDMVRSNWVMRFGAWCIHKRYKCGMITAYSVLISRMPNLLANDANLASLRERLANHIENGIDVSDKYSAGGLNANEVKHLISYLSNIEAFHAYESDKAIRENSK